MRCTDSSRRRNSRKRYKTKRRNQLLVKILLFIIILALLIFAVILGLSFFENNSKIVKYETDAYTQNCYTGTLFSEELCVEKDNVEYSKFQSDDEFKSLALFNLSEKTVLLSQNIHERIYPASTTKLMTFYLAMKYCNLDDIVTVNESATILPSGSSRAWLKAGDSMSMKDLLYSMMIASGNDSAIAIAEHISGTEDEFAKLMTEEAKLLGATNTNFVNAHGYHDDNHYTTTYDLYLIMNQCLKFDAFIELISTSTYRTAITEPDGYQRKVEWIQTNFFLNGTYPVPSGITVIGGKTGTTDAAGDCLMLYCLDGYNTPHLAIIMGAESRDSLYTNMSNLIATLAK